MMRNRAIDTLWPAILLWAVLIPIGFAFDADWPNDRRYIFATLVVWATFNVVLPTMMIRRMHGWDWLTVTLAAAFAMKALVPLYFMASILWPRFWIDHRTMVLYVISGLILTGMLAAMWMFVRTPENGYARGVTAGIAQEKHDQHDREMAAAND